VTKEEELYLANSQILQQNSQLRKHIEELEAEAKDTEVSWEFQNELIGKLEADENHARCICLHAENEHNSLSLCCEKCDCPKWSPPTRGTCITQRNRIKELEAELTKAELSLACGHQARFTSSRRCTFPDCGSDEGEGLPHYHDVCLLCVVAKLEAELVSLRELAEMVESEYEKGMCSMMLRDKARAWKELQK
jgi:hypothetical protein